MNSATQPAASDVSRDAFRESLIAKIPGWYSPWVHLAFPSLVGLGLIATAICCLRDLQLWQLAAVPIVYLISNAAEWRAHRDLLHKRTPPLQVLYDRHTPEHHRVYVRDDMSIRSSKEFRLVLIPAYGVLLIFVSTFPITCGLFSAGQQNLACLFVATTMGYVVGYEWLHLSYHLPATSFIGKRWIVRILRKHHATHHQPELMQKWNFNVTVPLWDWVRGTIYRETSNPETSS